MVPPYFVLIKCLNLGIPSLKSNSGEEEQFKGSRTKALTVTRSTVRMCSVGKATVGRCENCLYYYRVLRKGD